MPFICDYDVYLEQFLVKARKNLSMKILLLGDLHLISPRDPHLELKNQRQHFALAWPSFSHIEAIVRGEAPDLIVSVGDIIDYFSEENVDFALEQMAKLKTPWLMTPGNHDLEPACEKGTSPADLPSSEDLRKRWQERGIALHNRSVDADGVRLIFLDSHNSRLPDGADAWLCQELAASTNNVLFTHVPLNVPEMRELILSSDPSRNMQKYTLNSSPEFFHSCIRGRIQSVFSGHLHFPGEVIVDGVMMSLLPLGIQSFGKHYNQQGRVSLIETAKEGGKISVKHLYAMQDCCSSDAVKSR